MQVPIVRPFKEAGHGDYSLSRMALYFLWLGTIGFGGPIALTRSCAFPTASLAQ